MRVKHFNVLIDQEPDPVYLGRDLFEPRKDLKGWRRWLHDWCFRRLRKLGAVMEEPPMRIVRHRTPIMEEGRRFTDLIQAEIESFAADLWTGGAKTLIVGREIYEDLMNGPGVVEGWITLDLAVPAGRGRKRGIFGLDLHVTDRIEGWIMLPGRLMADGRYSEEERGIEGLLRGSPELFETTLSHSGRRR